MEMDLGLKSRAPEEVYILVLPFATGAALTSMSLSFLICKMGTVLVSSLQGSGEAELGSGE